MIGIRNSIMLSALLPAAFGQTRIDLKSQAKDVDFTAAGFTRPVKTGTQLPATCSVAELYLRTESTSEASLFACVAANTWLKLSGSGAAEGVGTALTVTRSGAAGLVIGSGCSNSAPCNVRFGNAVYSIQSSGTVTLTSGTGLAFIYVAATGEITVGHNLALTCSGCTAQAQVSGFPADSIPLFTWSASAGAWDPSGGVDFRAVLSAKRVIAGTGLMSSESAGTTILSVDPPVGAGITEVHDLPLGTCNSSGTYIGPSWMPSEATSLGCGSDSSNGVYFSFPQSTPRAYVASLLTPSTVSAVNLTVVGRQVDGNGYSAALNVSLACPPDETFTPIWGTPDVITWESLVSGKFTQVGRALTVPASCSTGGPRRLYLKLGGRATAGPDLPGSLLVHFIRLEITR